MSLKITFSIKKRQLIVEQIIPGASSEKVIMQATSGGWDGYKHLPKGNWVITENPSGFRSYFGLFLVDNNINDQFLHDGKWRDGIRFGYHDDTGSHGCIMTKPSPGQSYIDGKHVWANIQKMIRTESSKKLLTYTNNQNPNKSDSTQYKLTSYGFLVVTD